MLTHMIMKKTRSSMKASVKLAGDHGVPSFLSLEKKGRGVVVEEEKNGIIGIEC